MEVQGIGPTDPSGVGDDSLNALKGVTPLLDILTKSYNTQTEILSTLKSVSSMSAVVKPAGESSLATIENTAALNDLTSTIKSATLNVTLNGTQSNFFMQLLKLASGDGKLTGLETATTIFSKAVKTLSSLESYAAGIDKVSASLLGAFGTVKEFGKGLLIFSAGLALLGFTLITFMEAITLEDMLTFAAVMFTIRMASELVGKGSWDLAKVSIGIATLGLAVWAFTEVVGSKMAVDFFESIVVISAGLFIMDKATSGMGKNTSGIIKGTLAIAAIAGSVWLLNKAVTNLDAVNLQTVAEMGLVTAGLGLVWYGMGQFMTTILQGSLAAAAIGASLWVLSKGVQTLTDIDLSLERGLELAAIIVGAAGILTLIGNPFTIGFTLAGAAGAAAVGGALWLLAKGVSALGTVSITEDQADRFAYSIGLSIDALSTLGNPFTVAKMLLAVPASLAVAGSTLALVGAVWAISKMQILGPEHYQNFSSAISNIVDAYTQLGGWDLAKATIAAGVVTLIAGTTMLSALAINAFTKISASPGAVTTAVESFDNFITGISTSMESNEGKFGTIGKGIKSFFGISSMVKEIADSVQAIGNLTFYEKSVVNGKVVITGTRKFTPNDFKNVGVSIGQILSALTEPLAAIGGSSDTLSIGGLSITNPFSNKVQKGIEALQGIGSVFNPLTNIVRTFADKGVDSAFVTTFNTNIAKLLGGIGTAFTENAKNVAVHDIQKMSLASIVLGNIANKLLHSKFSKSAEPFERFSKNLVSVKSSINGMDLTRLSKFNTMLGHLNELAKGGALEELVATFKEFLEEFVDFTNRSGEEGSQAAAPATKTSEPGAFSIVKTETKQLATNTGKSAKEQQMNNEAARILQQLHDLIASGSVTVKVKNTTF
jgi:hypothetical protein